MPQTRFVLKKAFAANGLRADCHHQPGKIDRPDARAHEGVLDMVFALFMWNWKRMTSNWTFRCCTRAGGSGVASWHLEEPGKDIHADLRGDS